MKTDRTLPLLAAMLAVCTTMAEGQARGPKQAPKATPAPAEAALVASADDSLSGDSTATEPADTVPKKHGGFMSKVKHAANSKVVRQVAKVAACTVVPGGQVIASAIDASSTGGGAAGAAQSVAGAATGSSCMPGMGGMGMGAGAAGVAANAQGAQRIPAGGGMAGADDPQAAAMVAGMQSKMGTTQMSPEQMAQLQAMMAGGGAGMPSRMGPPQMSPAQMAQMQAMMAGGGAGMPSMPDGMPAGEPAEPGVAGGMPGEAEGRSVELPSDLAGALKQGRLVVRNIDWAPGSGSVSAAGATGFAGAMAQVAAAVRQAGGTYRLDLYMNPQSADVVVKTLGPQRLSTVQATFVQAGGAANPAAVPQIGKVKKDKDPRLEIVRAK